MKGKRHWMAVVLFILGGLCLLYCLGIMASGAFGSKFFLIWILVAALLLGLSVLTHMGVWGKMPSWVWKTVAAFFVFCGLWLVFIEGLILGSFGAQGEKGLDYLVVLGAQMKENGPSIALTNRLDTAYAYLTENPDTLAVLSGGQGSNEPVSEAQGMYEYLVEKGVSPERLILEDQSVNTVQNLQFSRKLIPSRASVGVVTNSFHVYRAVQLAKSQGYETVCGISAPSDLYFLLNNMFREFFGVMKDWMFGNMKLIG